MIIRRYKSYKLLQPLPRPEELWRDISINFITDLPLSLRNKRVYNMILVVVDRHFKIVYFIPIIKDTNVFVLADLMFDEVVKYYNIFKLIMPDRGSIFIS